MVDHHAAEEKTRSLLIFRRARVSYYCWKRADSDVFPSNTVDKASVSCKCRVLAMGGVEREGIGICRQLLSLVARGPKKRGIDTQLYNWLVPLGNLNIDISLMGGCCASTLIPDKQHYSCYGTKSQLSVVLPSRMILLQVQSCR